MGIPFVMKIQETFSRYAHIIARKAKSANGLCRFFSDFLSLLKNI